MHEHMIDVFEPIVLSPEVENKYDCVCEYDLCALVCPHVFRISSERRQNNFSF